VVFLFILLHPPRSPLFPYTTLFRSRRQTQQSRRHRARYFPAHRGSPSRAHFPQTGRAQRAGAGVPPVPPSPPLHPFLTGGRPRLPMFRLQGRAGAAAGLTPETASTPGLRATPPNGPPPLSGKSPIDAAAAHTPLLRASTW